MHDLARARFNFDPNDAMLRQTQFFDTREIREERIELSRIWADENDEHFANIKHFLPYPRVLIQTQEGFGLFLEELPDNDTTFRITAADDRGAMPICEIPYQVADFGSKMFPAKLLSKTAQLAPNAIADIVMETYTSLFFINTPQSLAQETKTLTRNFRRYIAQHSVDSGKIETSWTALRLKINSATLAACGEDDRIGVFGKKCFHWVRAHLRTRADGQVVYVSSHTRGDIALGVRRKRYELAKG